MYNKTKWIEVKSYKRTPKSKYFEPWQLSNKKSYPNHRQFFLDRVANVPHGDDERLSGSYEWWFHGFKRKTIEGYQPGDLTKLGNYMAKLPTKKNVGKASLGLLRGQTYNMFNNRLDVRDHLHRHDVKTWLLNTAKDHLLEEIPQDVIDELITNAANDI